MIIWRGLGILVGIIAVVSAIIGVIIGSAVGHPGIGLAIGMVIAALANWGLCKLLYAKPPQILVDPATSQQVLLKPSHSLFFIPAPAWTWIFAVLVLPAFAMGILGERSDAKKAATPGYAGFKAANDLIDSNSKGQTHGNNDAAKKAATSYSTIMKAMSEMAFSGGSKKNLMTGGDFLTYCQETPDTIIFLCHVPSLRSYKTDEVKDGLQQLAWMAANQSAAAMDPENKKTIIVGLRGIGSYAYGLKGTHGAEEPTKVGDLDEATLFYPAFTTAGAPAPKN